MPMKELKLLLLFFSAIIIGSFLHVMAEETNSPQTVKMGAKWTYKVEAVSSYGAEIKNTIVTMFFKDSVEHNGKMYRILQTETGDSLAAMREENRKIYLHADVKNIQNFRENYGEEAYNNEEILLYDFGAQKGKSITVPVVVIDRVATEGVFCAESSFINYNIEETDTIETTGFKRVRQKWNLNYNCVEGIGVNHSYIHIPIWETNTGGHWTIVKFVEFEDEHGKFTPEDFDRDGLGIEEVTMPENGCLKDTRKYDLFGRQIENPARGTIYIQAGRKFVAK